MNGHAALNSSLVTHHFKRARGSAWTLAFAGLLLAGCGNPKIEVEYGQRGGGAAKSVNGTAVLADMFEQAGHRVQTWFRLSPTLQEADAIVWFPDNFRGPKKETRAWLQEWLAAAPNRTLIYVGRDYDAEPAYWQAIQPLAPPEQVPEVGVRLQEATARFVNQRGRVLPSEDVDWYASDGKLQPRQVRTLDGPLNTNVDAKKVEIELNGRFTPPKNAQGLLASSGDALVTRQTLDTGGNVIVVTNGSFLLNYSLINHEHRKLAGKLIDEIGSPPQSVFFLESAYADPPIVNQDPKPQVPTGMEFFHVWPLNYILLHLGVLGVLLMLARWPIFGIARSLPKPPLGDFGQHIKALGALLQRTRQREDALMRVRHYQQLTGVEVPVPPSPPKNQENSTTFGDG